MTDTQLYLAIGLPVFAILMSTLAATLQINSPGGSLSTLNANMNARFAIVDARFNSVDNRFSSLENSFDTLTGKSSMSIIASPASKRFWIPAIA